jgi:hypothetical protein
MRSAVGQAQGAATTAANTSTQLGTEAQGIGSTLTPFLTQEMEHPQGYSQQDESAMLSAGDAGAGGATSAIQGAAAQRAAQTHNGGAFGAVLDDAARQKAKAAAGSSESVAAADAGVKQQQQQDGARGLQGMYGTDTSGMLDASGQVSKDVGAEVQANNSGWLQNATGVMNAVGSMASGAGSMGLGFGAGQKFGCWIAAEVYHGWLDPRTVAVRNWIFGDFQKKRAGRILGRAYLRYGARIAGLIRRMPVLRQPFKALFDCALREALA